MKSKITYFIFLFFVYYGIVAQNKDTINWVDASNKKQGLWTVYGKNKPGSCFKLEQVVETGRYQDNKKTGTWTENYCNGNIKSHLTFKEGRPDGPAKIFYENGKLKEEGTWKANRWIGNYKIYNEDGTLLNEFFFDEKGKKEEPK